VYSYNGETPTVTPIVLAQQVDYATHGFPPATERAFIDEGVRILRPPIYSGPAIYFNHTIYPFNVTEVRQAIAHAVDRHENGTVSLGESGKAAEYMAGFSDNIVPLWIDDPGALNAYELDRDKAAGMLEDLGFSKGADGIWVTDTGEKMEYELTAPAEYADWSAAAENLAEQLTEFGIATTFRGVEYHQHPIDVNKGEFELAIRGWGSGNPHPHFSFVSDLYTHNIEAPEGDGMSYEMVQTTECCGEFDFETNIDNQTVGLDVAAQKAMVAETAKAYNELLPNIPLWERYGNNPAMDGLHTCGWLPEGDPIYKNSPYADSFVVLMILDGTLYPCNQ
jgi:peptide/nickel transport system substrate-binding protein